MSAAPQGNLSSEELLQERQRLEQLYKDKYTREITVMFTDLKDSTSLTENEGDMTARELIQSHNSILFPLIEQFNGTLVKTMGDGTMSYFEQAQDAQRTAVAFQKALITYNANPQTKLNIVVRIGLNTGVGIVEEDDIYGDVVNVAARFEALAGSGEVYMSESCFQSLSNKGEFYSRMIKHASLKGKSEQVQVYKVFWDPAEVEHDKETSQNKQSKPASSFDASGIIRIVLFISTLLVFVFLLMQLTQLSEEQPLEEKTRSTTHKVLITFSHYQQHQLTLNFELSSELRSEPSSKFTPEKTTYPILS